MKEEEKNGTRSSSSNEIKKVVLKASRPSERDDTRIETDNTVIGTKKTNLHSEVVTFFVPKIRLP